MNPTDIIGKAEKQELFEALYKTYPKKERKVDGFKYLNKQIKTYADLANFTTALNNYLQYLKDERREKQYTLQFGTFCNDRWIDFIDYKSSAGVSLPIHKWGF